MKRREFLDKAFKGMGAAWLNGRGAQRSTRFWSPLSQPGASMASMPGGSGIVAVGPSTIRFDEITKTSGVTFMEDSDPDPNKNQPETMVSGVGMIDYDNDGYLDLFFVNGAAIPSLIKSSPIYYNRLYHNNHDGTFTDVTEKAGVSGAGAQGYDMGIAVGDYDNDGWEDIFIASVTKNHLYHNNRDGTFTDVTDKAGVGAPTYNGHKMWSAAAAWVDFDNDGKLDLFVSNYVVWSVDHDPLCLGGGRIRAYCHPKFYKPLPCSLYRNNGDGTFTDVSEETGISKVMCKGMGVAINDYDHDGYVDIFVGNDTFPNKLFHNLKGKYFKDVALDVGVAYPESGQAVSAMGVEFRDLNNDSWPDIWHTDTELETFPLFQNLGNGFFDDVTGQSGLARTTLNYSGWSNGVADFDNDGLKDLFAARGNVLDNIALFSDRTYAEPCSIFRNMGKMTFQEVTSQAGPDMQIAKPHRGGVLGDLFNSGRQDIVATVLNGPARILRNTSVNSNHWVSFRLVGTKSNRMAIGAQLKVTTDDGNSQYDIVSTSAGYAASRDPRAHFGLGPFKTVKQVEIQWPSGIHQVLKDVPADQIHRVVEST